MNVHAHEVALVEASVKVTVPPGLSVVGEALKAETGVVVTVIGNVAAVPAPQEFEP